MEPEQNKKVAAHPGHFFILLSTTQYNDGIKNNNRILCSDKQYSGSCKPVIKHKF